MFFFIAKKLKFSIQVYEKHWLTKIFLTALNWNRDSWSQQGPSLGQIPWPNVDRKPRLNQVSRFPVIENSTDFKIIFSILRWTNLGFSNFSVAYTPNPIHFQFSMGVRNLKLCYLRQWSQYIYFNVIPNHIKDAVSYSTFTFFSQ